jgi:arylsulfatase
MEGVSMLYSFDNAKAADRHVKQYFEMFGNRAIYNDGWLAGTIHKAPWETKPRRPLTEDVWELYNVRADFSLANDLAASNADKLAEMQAVFMTEAEKYHVLPIDDRTVERVNPQLAGRPDLMGGRASLTLAQGMTGMSENVFLNVKNKSKTITAEVEIPAGGGQGTIIAQGGRFGGWSLYMNDGKPGYHYNFLGMQHFVVESAAALAPGKATVRFEFAYEGPGLAKGGTGSLYVNDSLVAEGRIEHTQPGIFSADETADVGIDLATPVVESVGAEAKSRFNGEVSSVTVAVHGADAAADAHLLETLHHVARATE